MASISLTLYKRRRYVRFMIASEFFFFVCQRHIIIRSIISTITTNTEKWRGEIFQNTAITEHRTIKKHHLEVIRSILWRTHQHKTKNILKAYILNCDILDNNLSSFPFSPSYPFSSPYMLQAAHAQLHKK